MTKAFRVTLFIDMNEAPGSTDEVVAELEHAIRLYDQDLPIASLSVSCVTPIEEATGPDGKVLR